MGLHDSQLKSDPAVEVSKFINGRWAWLGGLMIGKRSVGDVALEGFSAKLRPAGWLVVVKGLNVVTMKQVVAFGSGERLYEALRNVTTSMRKAEWKSDQYTPEIFGV